MLLVDSDRCSLSEAIRGDLSDGLEPSEILAAPLRPQEEYHQAAEKYLLWLRRRWFCRIPRSHSAEGLRPLGRLALVDHGPELITRLRAAIAAITSAEARAVAGQQIGQDLSGVAPQIILVASISGGTGSGMLLDAAYVLRKVLADCSLSHVRLTGVLLHSTGRSPHDKLLARANACACLRELERFGNGEGYPGDATFGLPASATDVPPLDAVRVLHLGDGLNGEEFAAAADNVAQFLDLATATAGSVFFDADDQPDWPRMAVRTYGMCRVGRAEEEIRPELLKPCLERLRPVCRPAAAVAAYGRSLPPLPLAPRFEGHSSWRRRSNPPWRSILIAIALSAGKSRACRCRESPRISSTTSATSRPLPRGCTPGWTLPGDRNPYSSRSAVME